MIYKKILTLLLVLMSCFTLYTNAAFPVNTTNTVERPLQTQSAGAYRANNNHVNITSTINKTMLSLPKQPEE